MFERDAVSSVFPEYEILGRGRRSHGIYHILNSAANQIDRGRGGPIIAGAASVIVVAGAWEQNQASKFCSNLPAVQSVYAFDAIQACMVPNDQSSFPEETAQRDAAWVQAVLAGNSETFGQLVEVYQKRALATAYRLLGNSHDAAEVVQEALIRAYRSLGHLKEPGRFGPWLMRIVSNLSLNARRSRHARRADSTVTLDEQWGNDSTASGNDRTLVSSFGPEREAEGRELQAAMDAALEKLPEKQRLALLLFTVDGLPQKEIAEILECSLEAVKWNVFQARKRLREELSELLESK